MHQDDVQAGCFSSFRLKNILGRRHRPQSVKTPSSAEKTKIQDVRTPCHHGGCQGAWSFSSTEPPPLYTTSSDTEGEKLPSVLTPEIISTIELKLDSLDSELRDLSHKIHSHPELSFEEFYAHDLLTDFMELHGFTVTRHYKLPTAWLAEYTPSPCQTAKTNNTGNAASTSKRIPVLGINSEMDGLPGIGHGCGHNLIAICGVGIALAVRDALEQHGVAGKILLLGTPAEESGNGKVVLLKEDAYKEMDVCLMSHPMPGPINSVAVMSTTALEEVTVEYFGKAAHAAKAPWEGKNALDAAVIAYSSLSALRQQLKPVVRVHGIIEGKDWVPNVIPDYAKLIYYIRAPTAVEVMETLEGVKGCFYAAASATGCEVKIQIGSGCRDLRQNSVLGQEFSANVMSRYNAETIPLGVIGASTDFGNVSYGKFPLSSCSTPSLTKVEELPSLHPGFAIPTEGSNHTIEFAAAAKTLEAHNATMTVTKALALTGFRVLADERFLKAVKDSFEEDKKSRLAAGRGV